MIFFSETECTIMAFFLKFVTKFRYQTTFHCKFCDHAQAENINSYSCHKSFLVISCLSADADWPNYDQIQLKTKVMMCLQAIVANKNIKCIPTAQYTWYTILKN